MWNKDKQNLQYYLTKRKYHTKEPKIHQENTKEHQEILQSFTLMFKRMVAILQQDYMRKMGENEREREKFWHNRVVVKT